MKSILPVELDERAINNNLQEQFCLYGGSTKSNRQRNDNYYEFLKITIVSLFPNDNNKNTRLHGNYS